MLAGVIAFRVCRQRAPISAAAGDPAFRPRFPRGLPVARSVQVSRIGSVINLLQHYPDSAMEAAGQVNYQRIVPFRIGAKAFRTG